jgi:hypothetical protein
MEFCVPVELVYNGKSSLAMMGPFEHSAEREFSLTVNRKAIAECHDNAKLREVAQNLLTGWSSMQTAVQSLMLENIKLRQAMAQQERDLEAADEIIKEAMELVECAQKSARAKRSLWPWSK